MAKTKPTYAPVIRALGITHHGECVVKNSIWHSVLDADFNARYWKTLVVRYSKREKSLQIFLAIMASGTVAGWGVWNDIPYLWKALSGISAIVAITLPILNQQKTIEEMSYLSGKWGELRIEYEGLWLQVKDSSDIAEKEMAYKKFENYWTPISF